MNTLQDTLKRVTLTHVLLILLVIATVANYMETRRMERALGSLYMATLEIRENTTSVDHGISAVNEYLNQGNDTLNQLNDAIDCMAHRRPPCTNFH